MMHAFKSFIAAAAALLAVGCLSPSYADPTPQPPGPTEPAVITSADGKTTHTFQVEFADTPAKAELGLMYRKEMAHDHGMIFDFGKMQKTTMWMKNCIFPEDMLFLDNDGAILAIAENARPGSERLIDPGVPVRGVLELNGGIVKEMGIKPGDKVSHKMFKMTPKSEAVKADVKPAGKPAPAKPAKPAAKTPAPAAPG